MALIDKLTAIAEAIRGKTGKTDAMTLDQMATEIEAISAGGGEWEEQFIATIERDTSKPVTKLPVGITKIGNYAFYRNDVTLSSLPEGLTSIGENAFRDCANLALTSLPDGITELQMSAFYGCTSLALTSLPDGMTKLGSYAFSGCTNLALTSLPDGITELSMYVFAGCTSLKQMRLHEKIRGCDSCAFDGCAGLEEVTFSGKPSRNIQNNVFRNCPNLTTINVPWAEGAVANAPWGATNATINYNYTGE